MTRHRQKLMTLSPHERWNTSHKVRVFYFKNIHVFMFVARYKRKGRETASSNVSDIYFGCIIASYLIVLLRLSSHMRVNLEFSFCRSLFITYFVCNELEAFTCRTLRVSRIDWSIGRPMKRQISSRDTHTRFVCISCDYMKKKKKHFKQKERNRFNASSCINNNTKEWARWSTKWKQTH